MIKIKDPTGIKGHMQQFHGTFNEFNNLHHNQYPTTPVVIEINNGTAFEFYVLVDKQDWDEMKKKYIAGMYLFISKTDTYFRLPLNVECPACGTSKNNTSPIVYCNKCGRGFIT